MKHASRITSEKMLEYSRSPLAVVGAAFAGDKLFGGITDQQQNPGAIASVLHLALGLLYSVGLNDMEVMAQLAAAQAVFVNVGAGEMAQKMIAEKEQKAMLWDWDNPGGLNH